ncbi:MAG: sigma-70 family RNA polymerase sigma factor [bacterium]|nr:sigma-70 family RNA polymerase sigma factor [bacterium]
MNDQNQNKTDNDDLKWIRKAMLGNHRAFEKLVLKYQQRIYFTVRKIVLDHDDADDIVQDTFVKTYQNLHRFDEHYPFYPWLRRIALNTTLNHQAKAHRKKESILDDDEFDHIESEHENPLQAMEQLPLDQRMVFILRTNDELSYEEIGEQLEISTGTVMSRLSRARAKLKEILQPYF